MLETHKKNDFTLGALRACWHPNFGLPCGISQKVRGVIKKETSIVPRRGAMGCSRISLPPVTQPQPAAWGLQTPGRLHGPSMEVPRGDVGTQEERTLPAVTVFRVTFLACPRGSLAHVYLSPFCREKQMCSWEVRECRIPLGDPRVTEATEFILMQVQSTLLLCKPLETTRGFGHLERVV